MQPVRPSSQKNVSAAAPDNMHNTQNTTGTRSLFDARRPSAIEITDSNKEEVVKLLEQRVQNGWRWITKGFINDDEYKPNIGYFSRYRVLEKTIAPKNKNDFESYTNIILVSNIHNDIKYGKIKKFYYIGKDLNMCFGNCPAEMNAQILSDYLNNYFFDIFNLLSNSVLRARQMPSLCVGDWIAMQGKTLQLIEGSTNLDLINRLKQQTSTKNEGNVSGRILPDDFFKDSYVRFAAAYIRHLERHCYLMDVFNAFFTIVDKAGNLKLEFNWVNQQFDKYKLLTLNKSVTIDNNNAKLIKQALGITVKSAEINAGFTIENVIPLKKFLELLTCCTPDYHTPILVDFDLKINNKPTCFLLSQDQYQKYQLTVSIEQKSRNEFEGHSYNFWFSNKRTVYSFNLKGAEMLLEQSFSAFKKTLNNPSSYGNSGSEAKANLLEFLVCTHVGESRMVPGNLTKSRIPGSGKLARGLIRKIISNDSNHTFIYSDDSNGKFHFPLAGKEGTGHTRESVNKLTRNTQFKKRNGDKNAPDYYMSDDSDVEFE